MSSSSKSRNFRRRGGNDDGEDDVTTATPSKPPPSTTTAATKPKKKSLLSFADDEDSSLDTAPITGPSKPPPPRPFSHKLTSAKDRSTPTPSSALQPQAGSYTPEALRELQKNTKTLAPRTHPKPLEPLIVLKGLVKPVEPDDVGDTVTKMGSMGLRKEPQPDPDPDPEIGDGIPDKATIEAIRAKRERLRQSGAAAADYIALDDGGNHGEAEGLSDEEPEFRGRIGFYGEKIENGKGGVFEDKTLETNVGVEGYVSEDEEDKMWEEEQVRKGLGKRMDDGTSRGVVSSSVGLTQSNEKPRFGNSATNTTYSSGHTGAVSGASTMIGGLPSLDVVPISQQAALAKKALLENMARLKESHGRTLVSLSKTEENLATSLSKVTSLEDSLSVASEKYIFMQKLRDFVSVICAFLQNKAPYIEELEDQMQKLHEERAAAILERRAADNDDEMKELEDAMSALLPLSKKSMGTTAEAIAAAAMRKREDLPVKLDEFGRDVNLQKRMDMSRRAAARKRRREKNDLKRMSAVRDDTSYQPIEGELSTDESDSESDAYRSNRDQLLQVAEQIFSDTHDEYSELSVVIEKFDRWKKDYASSYRDAYMPLSIPAIFSPYVRLELLTWDPLHENSDFMDMKWHSLLFNYGLPEDENESSMDDSDANLIPQLVEKLAIPILHNQLANCWDMLSTRESRHAVSAMKLVLRYGPFSGSALSNLVAVLRDRLTSAIANLTVPTWDPHVIKSVPDAARVAAYRFGMSIRLMRNICLFHEILAMPVLEKLALDDLLIGKVLPHLLSIQGSIHDAVTRAERVVASLSGVWTGSSVTGVHSPKLRHLVDYLLRLGKRLEKRLPGGGELETAKFARRLKKMLVELNEYDHAREICRTFNIKEAL